MLSFKVLLLCMILLAVTVDGRRRRRNRRVARPEPARRVAAPPVNRRVPRPEVNRRVRRVRRVMSRVGGAIRRLFGRRRRRNRRVARPEANARVRPVVNARPAPTTTVMVRATQPPHPCHSQMMAIQACAHRCHGRRRRRRRCQRGIAACQNIAREALRQCMTPVPVNTQPVVTQPPHRCQAQIDVLNSCNRHCRGRRCRKDKRRCRRAAKAALRACIAPVTVPAPTTTAATVTAATVTAATVTAAPLPKCYHARRRVRRCRTRACRHRYGRKLRRCLGIPPRPVQYLPCARQIRRLVRCKSHHCRRVCRRALRRCRGIAPRTLPLATAAPRVPHVCDRYRIRLATCRHHRCRVAARCRFNQCHCHGGVRRLRKLLRYAGRAASSCGDVDRSCVDRCYGRVARLKHRIAKEKRRCRNRAHKSCRRIIKRKRNLVRIRRALKKRAVRKDLCKKVGKKAVRRLAKRVRCLRKRRRVARLVQRRRGLMRAVRACSSSDAKCATRLLARVLKLNRKLRRFARRCKVALPKRRVIKRRVIKRKLRVTTALACGKHVYSDGWRNAVGCDTVRRHLKAWQRYWNCKRRVLFAEHKRCNPLDTSCMRFAFTQLIHIAQRLDRGRRDATERLRVCDECAPIKIAYRRWLHRQRVRRLRLHNQIMLCGHGDVPCQARRLRRIMTIQANIEHRRRVVSNLHGECRVRGGTHSGFMSTAYTTTVTSVTLAPIVERMAGAAVTAVPVLLLALALLF